MKKPHYIPLCVALSISLSMNALAANIDSPSVHETTTTISVNGRGNTFPVSADLYGAFYEEINRAGDGGLYAEMIRNRSFEDGVLPPRCGYQDGHGVSPTDWDFVTAEPDSIPGWTPFVAKGADITLSLERTDLMNPAQERALRMDLHTAGTGETGVANAGLAGLSVEKGASYRLSFWTKARPGLKGPIHATLRSRDGHTIFASAELTAPDTGWEKRETVLTSNTSDHEAQLCLSVNGSGVWWLDMVSLFPNDTYKGRENGLRTDLVDMVDGLKPSFFRFPGGCIVEGFSRETIWHWKNTVGPIEQRPEHQLLWGYRTTGGLGFHEFLQLCEDLDMAPMFVFNCGMTCQGRNCELLGEDAVQSLIQEALDGLEYANGSADTKHGALRAANGHAKPFNIRYVEIGNENYGPEYEKRYAAFYKAIRDRYPDIRIIANDNVRSAPADIVDEHFYASPAYFISNFKRYDSYDRNGPKIYVGEYAVAQECGKGNLKAAVAEAAFLTGIERNQDVVTMTSYAPLFANLDYAECWYPDAINFDNHRSYGTPFYHVMGLFANNRGDVVIPVSVNTPTRPNFIGGTNGLEISGEGTRIQGMEIATPAGNLLHGNAQDILQRSEIIEGYPAAVDDIMTAGNSGHCVIRFPDRMTNGTLRMRVTFPADGGEVIVRVRDNGYIKEKRDFTNLELVSGMAPSVKIRHVIGWSEEKLGEIGHDTLRLLPERSYAVELTAKDDTYTLRIDGQTVLECAMPRLPDITASATFDNKANELVLKVVNTTMTEQRVGLSIDGVDLIGNKGRLTTITGAPDEENSLDEPLRVAPKTADVILDGEEPGYTFAPCSVNVLRLPCRKR